jgi:hypothetical protein
MASVVKRCFPSMDPLDRERAAAAWRAVLSSSRKQYLKARDAHGGFGGYVDESTLLPIQVINAKIEQLPLGSANRCLLKLLQSLVPTGFPQQYRVNSPRLNLGNIHIIAGDAAVAAAPTHEVWRDSACNSESGGLLLVTENALQLYLLFDVTTDGPVTGAYNIIAPALAAEVRAYLASLPPGAAVMFPQIKGPAQASSKAYIGLVGRDSFNARINMILAKAFGKCGGVTVTQNTFRLSLVQEERNKWQQACNSGMT